MVYFVGFWVLSTIYSDLCAPRYSVVVWLKNVMLAIYSNAAWDAERAALWDATSNFPILTHRHSAGAWLTVDRLDQPQLAFMHKWKNSIWKEVNSRQYSNQKYTRWNGKCRHWMIHSLCHEKNCGYHVGIILVPIILRHWRRRDDGPPQYPQPPHAERRSAVS